MFSINDKNMIVCDGEINEKTLMDTINDHPRVTGFDVHTVTEDKSRCGLPPKTRRGLTYCRCIKDESSDVRYLVHLHRNTLISVDVPYFDNVKGKTYPHLRYIVANKERGLYNDTSTARYPEVRYVCVNGIPLTLHRYDPETKSVHKSQDIELARLCWQNNTKDAACVTLALVLLRIHGLPREIRTYMIMPYALHMSSCHWAVPVDCGNYTYGEWTDALEKYAEEAENRTWLSKRLKLKKNTD